MKHQCDKHGCNELLCGCPTSVLDSGDRHEIIRAKNKVINELLKIVSELDTAKKYEEKIESLLDN